MSTALKKTLLIFILTLIALFVALPHRRPINLSFGPLKTDKSIVLPGVKYTFRGQDYENNFDLKLGLDLAGGTHLVFLADTSGIDAARVQNALEAAKAAIEKRVNLFGVAEPNIQTSEFEGQHRIIVELPGIDNPAEAVSLIGKTAQLQFAQIEQVGESEEEGVNIVPTDLTGADLETASVVFNQSGTGEPAVSITFSQEGGEKFAAITENNIGKPLAILLDGQVVSAPVVQEKITGGVAQITGDFDIDSAKELAIQLEAGALPLPVELVEQRTIGATLGAESVAKSVRAGIVGLVAVLVFMILSYGRLGLVADLALIIFGILTLALYKLIPVVLTLPGIAGFMLSVGMAVDSNILIFERFKEEREKRDFEDAMEISFGRAWDSIRDANIATLFTAFILANPLDWQFLNTSGPVRGFAITLALGIGISLFTGIVVSRNLLRVFVQRGKTKK